MRNYLFFTSTCILLLVNRAFAQDMGSTNSSEVGRPYIKVEAGISIPNKPSDKEGLYGFNLAKIDKMSTVGAVIKNKPSKAKVFVLGGGYRINDHLRAEVSLRARTSYNWEISLTDKMLAVIQPSLEDLEIAQKFQSTSLMLHGYYDIARVGNLIPYVSLGLGYARNKVGDYKVSAYDNRVLDGPFDYIVKGKSSSSFTWDIGVGTLLQITKNIGLDVNYRCIDLGKYSTKGIIKSNGSKPAAPRSPITTKLKAQEITTGITFNF